MIDGFRGSVTPDAILGPFTTYRIGGPARLLVQPADPEDVARAVQFASAEGWPWLVLGLGSNVLIRDEGFPGLVIRVGRGLDDVVEHGTRWRVGAGLPSPQLARRSARAGLAGAHKFVGIPGTVGGGVSMNAGCHGAEFSSLVRSVTVIDAVGADRVIDRRDIDFAYRTSGLRDVVVVETELDFEPSDAESLVREQGELFVWRRTGTPFDEPCCGSVFRNPSPDLTAGQAIDTAGLKGYTVGGARVSNKHANYIVNVDGATAADVLAVIDEVRRRVAAVHGVQLELEVKVLGGVA